MKPAMRMVCAIQEEDRDQHQRGEAEQRKDHGRMFVAAVINSRRYHHG